ncbi:MAG: alpha-galactosidase [Clostridiales bacterium]|nr:alpha-galactosidase [Clostridiales bacterium]
MSISFQVQDRLFTLHTRTTTYQMQIGPLGYLCHLYYGRRTEGSLSHLYRPEEFGFSPNPYPLRLQKVTSLDTMPQEYTGCNTGDFRVNCLTVSGAEGAYGAEFRYVSHAILPGKYAVEGMPSAFAGEGEAETLVITLADTVTGLELELYYGVFEERDVITRAARLRNAGENALTLERAASLCLDFPFGDWDLLHFQGRHNMERQVVRAPITGGIQTVSSRRGASSHQHNPFVILAGRDATEDQGDCCGLMLVYSGSHRTDVERDQSGGTRVVMGIQDGQFRWTLAPGEHFQTPEVLLTFSHEGLGQLSRNYHRFIRGNLCRSPWVNRRRPVLINNWEATYFDFDTDKIISIARQASALGVELLVLDDGWFGSRYDENRGLGDWFVNEKKLPGGLDRLISEVNGLGMQFGLWVEPEMVNEDSDLYRAHPDWALTLPGRAPTMGRNQLVLDMGRDDVVEYLYQRLSALLERHNISYIKWDMNRSLTDVYSRALPPERQGEAAHRYVLGVYALLERLTARFPEVLLEGCAGGGGRFDAGMLAYCPQIWCSDDTDAVERLSIQYGTSFGYPVSAMGAHVSACPNHQTGRMVPLDTRGVVAMHGTFGYELDLNLLTEAEKAAVRRQIDRFHRYADLIGQGDYYRLTDPARTPDHSSWQTVSPDKSEALVSVVVTHVRATTPLIRVQLRGLEEDARYRVSEFAVCSGGNDCGPLSAREEGRVYTGGALMYGGFVLPRLYGDCPSVQIHLEREQ